MKVKKQNLIERKCQSNLYFFKNMDRINRTIQKAYDIDSMMSDTLEAVLSIFNCDRAFLMHPCDPEAGRWTSPLERTKQEYPGVLKLGLTLPFTPEIRKVCHVLLDSDRPVKFDPDSDIPQPEDPIKSSTIKSSMAMALLPKIGKPWQFGIHQCSYMRTWTPAEEKLFQEIGWRLANGLTSWVTFRELKKCEQRYRQIVDTANEGIWVIDKEFKITFVNQQMARILGYTRKEIIGRPAIDFIAESVLEDQYKRWKDYRNSVTEKYERQFRCSRGKIMWALISATPVFNDDHGFNGFFEMVTDITVRKQAEKRLQKLNDELEACVLKRTEELQGKSSKLEAAIDDIKMLKGLFPICSHCKKIRDDKGNWHEIESYISRHSEADFSHSICPECGKKYYSDYNLDE